MFEAGLGGWAENLPFFGLRRKRETHVSKETEKKVTSRVTLTLLRLITTHASHPVPRHVTYQRSLLLFWVSIVSSKLFPHWQIHGFSSRLLLSRARRARVPCLSQPHVSMTSLLPALPYYPPPKFWSLHTARLSCSITNDPLLSSLSFSKCQIHFLHHLTETHSKIASFL